MKKSFFIIIYSILFVLPRITAYCQQNENWAQLINADDPPWPGVENATISKGVRLSDGYVICGTAKNAIFPSRNGDSIGRTNWGGPFVAKYDFSGNLIWLDYGIDSMYASQQISQSQYWSQISSVTADSAGNIYICGKFPINGFFYYNGGTQSTHISTVDGSTVMAHNAGGNFIAKLNPLGVPIWHGDLYGVSPKYIANTANKGIVLAGLMTYAYASYQSMTDSFATNNFNVSPDWGQFLYWIDTAGRLTHYTYTNENSANFTGFIGVETDASGNAVLCSKYEQSVTFHNADDTTTHSLTTVGSGAAAFKFYAVKYDTTGKFVWSVNDKNTNPTSFSVTPNGTLYTYNLWSTGANNNVYFVNANNTTDSFKIKGNAIYKINKDGMMQWHANLYSGYNSALSATDSGVTFAGVREYSSGYISSSLDTVFSANGIGYRLVHTYDPNIFFLKYDSAGTIMNSSVIGYASGYIYFSLKSLIKTHADDYILCGNLSFTSGIASYNLFTDSLIPDGEDGLVVNYAFNGGDTLATPFYDPVLSITGISKDSLCVGDTLIIRDTAYGDFLSQNTFKLELSNIAGSFAGGITLLATSATYPDSFVCVIPGISASEHYNIRISSTIYPRFSTAVPIVIQTAAPTVLAISTLPSGTVDSGTAITFIAHAVIGGGSITYQWYKNNIELTGEVNDTFTTADLLDNDTIKVVSIHENRCSADTVSKTVGIHINTPAPPPVVSVRDVSSTLQGNIYPNPVRNIINLSFPQPLKNGTIKLSNILGETVFEQLRCKGSNFHFNVGGMPTGIYFIDIEDQGKQFHKKMIKY